MHHDSFFADPHSWVYLAFVLFVILFGRKLWSALAAILDQRAEAIRNELAEAQRLRHEAAAMLKDATAQRATALAEAKALLDGAHAEAARLAQAAADEAKAAAARREQQAMDRIAAAEKAALDEVRIAAAEVATAAARAVIRDGLTTEAGAALVDTAIAGLPTALRAA
jgi:F-type H+-transporting ATPase subunit b